MATLHAGGLLAAIQYEERLARPYESQCALLVGLVSTLLAGAAALVHYNALADRWRHEMHYEIEGAKTLSDAAKQYQAIADKADIGATGLFVISIGALIAAGIWAI